MRKLSMAIASFLNRSGGTLLIFAGISGIYVAGNKVCILSLWLLSAITSLRF